MKLIVLVIALFLIGCAPSSESLSQQVDCKEFSIQLPAGWRPGKNIVTANGVHLVSIHDARNTLVNLYVYPRDSLDVAVLNDFFFKDLSAELTQKGTLTSEEPIARDLFDRPSVFRTYSFTMEGGTAVFDLYTVKKVLKIYEIGVLINVRDRHRIRSLRDLPSIIDSIAEKEAPNPENCSHAKP